MKCNEKKHKSSCFYFVVFFFAVLRKKTSECVCIVNVNKLMWMKCCARNIRTSRGPKQRSFLFYPAHYHTQMAPCGSSETWPVTWHSNLQSVSSTQDSITQHWATFTPTQRRIRRSGDLWYVEIYSQTIQSRTSGWSEGTDKNQCHV